ncbi:MAG: hypothetical protein AAF845_02465 [Bacteroidota bacterium]
MASVLAVEAVSSALILLLRSSYDRDDFDSIDLQFEVYSAADFEARPEAQMVRAGMVVSDGTVNFAYATPEVCLHRADVPPRRAGRANGLIACVPEAVCRANTDPRGGLREGRH